MIKLQLRCIIVLKIEHIRNILITTSWAWPLLCLLLHNSLHPESCLFAHIYRIPLLFWSSTDIFMYISLNNRKSETFVIFQLLLCLIGLSICIYFPEKNDITSSLSVFLIKSRHLCQCVCWIWNYMHNIAVLSERNISNPENTEVKVPVKKRQPESAPGQCHFIHVVCGHIPCSQERNREQ